MDLKSSKQSDERRPSLCYVPESCQGGFGVGQASRTLACHIEQKCIAIVPGGPNTVLQGYVAGHD